MRHLIALFAATLLVACSQGEVEVASPNPEGVEPVPTQADPIGTESGGAAKAPSEIAWNHFGSEFTLTDSVKAADFIPHAASYADKEILVEGTVVDVCQKAGCWMVISDGTNTVRVTMKDHGFSVAKDGTGSWARIQGVVKQAAPDAATTEHLLSESKRPELAPETKGQDVSIEATGVAFQIKS